MARIIHPDGTTLPLHPPEDGEAYTLAEVYAAIGCDMVQELRIARDEVLLIDENAKLGNEPPPVNILATGMVHYLAPYDKILGTALHVASRDGEWVPLTAKDKSE